MAKIKVCKNGPYIVSGKIPVNQQKTIFDSEGSPLKTEIVKNLCSDEEITLCRCGGSDNKPFCDGSHRKNGFDGSENTDNLIDKPSDTEFFDGPKLTLQDTPCLCSGAGFCHRAGGVWDLTQESDNPKSKKIAIEECHCCPSGRLIALDPQTGKAIEDKVDSSVGVDSFGPLCVTGEVSIESSEGKNYPHRPRRALCRCGKSRNKPFCDGSHFD
ncbi:MAG: CDGSH iron-sulfur domain-containing protein [Candidatus Shapirobacteria bacterium]|nr:CDGSH iron-sulfur domain-containing protein [Candidatus Shapirobacteria bacterium]